MEDHRFVVVVGSRDPANLPWCVPGCCQRYEEGFLFGATDWIMPIIRPENVPVRADRRCALPTSKTLLKPRRVVRTLKEDQKCALGVRSLDEGSDIGATLQKSDRGLMNTLQTFGAARGLAMSWLSSISLKTSLPFRRTTGADRQEVVSWDETAAFVNMLLRSCADPAGRIWVVLTMRSDFIGNCEAFLACPKPRAAASFSCRDSTANRCRRRSYGLDK